MSRAYHAIVHALAVIAALVLGLVALLVTIDVLARNLRIGTLAWIAEVSEYSLPLATFFVAPWLLDRGEHVRLDIALQLMGRRAALWTERIADCIGLAISLVFVFYSVRLIDDSIRLGSKIYKTLEIPEWWTYAPVPLCFALLAIGFIRRLGNSRAVGS